VCLIAESGNRVQGKRPTQVRRGAANPAQAGEGPSKTLLTCYTDCPPVIANLYINSADVTRLYSQPRWLWLLCPLLLYWISHIWIKTHRGEMHDDPVIFAVQDRSSWLVLVLGACGLCLAMW
jgi:4-hydroxybenzoate polyprenyltransferase